MKSWRFDGHKHICQRFKAYMDCKHKEDRIEIEEVD